jgi:hypothetical protein
MIRFNSDQMTFIFHFSFFIPRPSRNINGQQYFTIPVSKPCYTDTEQFCNNEFSVPIDLEIRQK